MKPIDRINKMRDARGFTELWEDKVREGLTYEEAYYQLEEEYAELVEQEGLDGILSENRYASYDSFRISKNKRIAANSQKQAANHG